MQIDTAAYQRVLGDELRSLRKQRGWTRKELNRRLQSEISLQTLATYELGTRQCSVVRLVEICVALGVPAHHVLARVHDRVFGEAPAGHLSVDLASVVADTRPELLPLRRWAQGRLNQIAPGRPAEVHLDLPALEYMAQLCRLSTVDLIRTLRDLDRNRS
ncbi:helix-turn-helix transcriptional regulator [Actinosynnema sp. NPDC050436]|uniref:helix-turn-helix domain-containing protein n=1 Tax=Actinosynnema sp. NPDC050436 TaxID=3155659 RepID=UPI0033D66832